MATKTGLTKKQYTEARNAQHKLDAVKADEKRVEDYKAQIVSYTEQIRASLAFAADLRQVGVNHPALAQSDSYFSHTLSNAESNAAYARQYRTEAERNLTRLQDKMAGKVEDDEDEDF